ncbi:MAG: response regulator [Candidatus Thermochlorobacter sp.]
MTNSKKTLLIADDEELIRDLLSDIFSGQYNLILCKDGAEAIQNFDEHRSTISAVITDLVMPKVSGDKVIQHIRKQSPNLPILIITGYERDTNTMTLQQDANVQVLQKPFRIDKLQSLLDDLLKR